MNNKTNTKKEFELIYDMLLNHSVNHNRFAYNIENDKTVGFGIIDDLNNFYTNLSIGKIPLTVSIMSKPVLDIIEPNLYVSIIIIKYNSKFGFIWSPYSITDDEELFYNINSVNNFNNFKINNLPMCSKKLIKLLSDTNTEFKIYGLKNKLFFEAKFINGFSIDQLKNSKYIKSRLDIWFGFNYFETKCIYEQHLNINSILYDNNQMLRFNVDYSANSANLDKSDNSANLDKSDNSANLDKSDKSSDLDKQNNIEKSQPIIDMFFNMNPISTDLNKQVNQILKKYESDYNLILGSGDEHFIILNKYVRTNNIEMPKHNLLFTYNYPIYLYSNLE